MADDIFEFLDAIYEPKRESGLWWSALENGVREWNKEQNKRMNPTATVDAYLHRKAQEKR